MPEIVKKLIHVIEDTFPPGFAEDWDNIGLQLGDPDAVVDSMLVTLDVTEQVIDEAVSKDIHFILTHHPLIFKPLKTLSYNTILGKLAAKLIKNDIGVYAAHTNLDSTWGGINDLLAGKIGIINQQVLDSGRSEMDGSGIKFGLGRVGDMEPSVSLHELTKKVKEVLEADVVKVVGGKHQEISRLALCGGAGADLIEEAKRKGAQCFITGDLKYHEARDAEALGISVIDAGHYHTEIIMIKSLCNLLKEKFTACGINVTVWESAVNAEPWKYY